MANTNLFTTRSHEPTIAESIERLHRYPGFTELYETLQPLLRSGKFWDNPSANALMDVLYTIRVQRQSAGK